VQCEFTSNKLQDASISELAEFEASHP